ncbi:MAG TPA: NAD(P)-dependent oxidoreductase [Natronosporangium sp.]
MATRTPLAVIGLGNMGGAVAANLADRGYQVAGFDPDDRARQRAAEAGVRPAGTIAEAVAGAGIVVTCLPNGEVVRTAWLADDGVVASAKPGTSLVELSTIGQSDMLAVARPATETGLRVLDCAVSGSPAQARNGELTLIVGAADDDLAAVTPVLRDIGSTLQHVGAVGMGKVVKLVNNLMAMGNVLVAAEAFQIGVAAGMDPQRLYEVLANSGGRSHHFVNRFPKAIAGDFRPGFTIALGEKDLTLGLELARAVGVPAPTAATVRAMYGAAIAEGLGADDIVGLLRMYQHWSSAG